MDHQESHSRARVLIFPLAAQGHVNSMLKLAEIIALSGVHVTFLNTEHVNDLLLRHTDVHTRLSRYHGFLFQTISDGLPKDYPRSGDRVLEVMNSMNEKTKAIFKEKMILGEYGSENSPSISCIIADGGLGGFTTDVADEIRVPIMNFRTISSCACWAYFCTHDLVQTGELPIKGEGDMDRLISGVPGMEDFLRCRDLPSFCRASDLKNNKYLKMVVDQTRHTRRAQAFILNTFEDLEGPIISQIQTQFPKIYSIGPLDAHLNVRLAKVMGPNHSTSRPTNNIFDMDRKCMAWLDKQPPKSVIYVSFGSIATLTKTSLMEFWHGLVSSRKRFLWVIRKDLLVGGEGEADEEKRVPHEVSEGTRERGFIVGWAPQEEVLSHAAVGGFLTHSGWNSTLESIVAGVPMICWPYFADQQTNSRFDGEVWKLGIDMKDVCDRNVVEKMVNDLMVDNRNEFEKSTAEMARLAMKSVTPGGSSFCNFDRLIKSIKLMGNLD